MCRSFASLQTSSTETRVRVIFEMTFDITAVVCCAIFTAGSARGHGCVAPCMADDDQLLRFDRLPSAAAADKGYSALAGGADVAKVPHVCQHHRPHVGTAATADATCKSAAAECLG